MSVPNLARAAEWQVEHLLRDKRISPEEYDAEMARRRAASESRDVHYLGNGIAHLSMRELWVMASAGAISEANVRTELQRRYGLASTRAPWRGPTAG